MRLFYFSIIILGLEITSSNAQTNTSDEIFETRDYVNGLINQIDARGADRFQVSTDYSKAGPRLQKRIKQKFFEYKTILETVINGSLGANIREYNELIRNRSLSSQEYQKRRDDLFKSIDSQMLTVQNIHQDSLESFFQIEPSWYVKKIETKNYFRWFWPINLPMIGTLLPVMATEGRVSYRSRAKAKVYFLDGTRKAYKKVELVLGQLDASENLQEDLEKELPENIKNEIKIRIQATLENECKTRICMFSLLADYASYFNLVKEVLAHPTRIELSDSSSFPLNVNETKSASYIIEALQSVQLGTDVSDLKLSN